MVIFYLFSTTSMHVDSSVSSVLMPTVDSIADVHDHTLPDHTAADIDELSECSDLNAQLNLSMQIQMAAMLSFAYIWSLGAFVPFRYTCTCATLAYVPTDIQYYHASTYVYMHVRKLCKSVKTCLSISIRLRSTM